MVNKSWCELSSNCPVDVSRIEEYAKDLESYLPTKISLETINKSKEDVLNAKGCFDSMVTTLIQLLYDRNILTNSEDKILYAWLVDNLGRYLRKLDDEEFNLIVKHDDPSEKNSIGISRVASFSKILRTATDTLIYESLLKATKEYNNFKETKEIKRNPRTFLYILFQILQVTLSILGGLTREKSGLTKKGLVYNIPTGWQSLMNTQGKELIKEGYEEETGVNVDKYDFNFDSIDEDEFQEDN